MTGGHAHSAHTDGQQCNGQRGSGMGPGRLLLAVLFVVGPACVDLTKPWEQAPSQSGGSQAATGGMGGATHPQSGGNGAGGKTGVGGGGATGGTPNDAPGLGDAPREGDATDAAELPDDAEGSDSEIDATISTGGTPGTGGSPGDVALGTGGIVGMDGAVDLGDPGTGGSVDGGETIAGGAGGTGAGGIAGTGGVIGTGGSTARLPYDCANAAVPPSGAVTDFANWDTATGLWGTGSNLYGSIFSYAGKNGTVNSPPTVAGTPAGLHLTGTVPSNGYAGGGVSFHVCATVATFTQAQFKIYGSAANCDIEMQIQTFDQRPTSEDPPGSCTASTCYQSPGISQIVSGSSLSSSVSTVTKPLSSFSNWSAANAGQVVGLQWQLSRNSGASSDCSYSVTITDLKFL